MVLAPLQDFLSFGVSGRMNYPGTTDGNWMWRMEEWQCDDILKERMADLNRRADRFRYMG